MQLGLALTFFSTVIVIWYNGDSIQEWTVGSFSAAIALIINILSKIFKKPGNPPTDEVVPGIPRYRHPVSKAATTLYNSVVDEEVGVEEEEDDQTPKNSNSNLPADQQPEEQRVFKHHTSNNVASSSKQTPIEMMAEALGNPEIFNADNKTYEKYYKNDESSLDTRVNEYNEYFREVGYREIKPQVPLKAVSIDPLTGIEVHDNKFSVLDK